MTLVRRVGKRGVRFGFRFWSRHRLYQVKGFSTRALAAEAEKRERRRVEVAAWEGRWGRWHPA